MESAAKKSFFRQSLKTGLFALIFSCIGVLLLALVAKLCNLSDGLLPVINQVSKALAMLLGVALGVKEEKFVLKALLGAAIYWALSVVLFSLLGGSFHWGQILLDLAISLAVALVVAFVKSRRA